MKVPNVTKGRVVPSTVQLFGETFHREKNLDEWFGSLCAVKDAAEALLADVRARYPGEALRCPYMVVLDATVKGAS